MKKINIVLAGGHEYEAVSVDEAGMRKIKAGMEGGVASVVKVGAGSQSVIYIRADQVIAYQVRLDDSVEIPEVDQ